MHSSRPRALLAMGLVTMAVIVYEIALTRLLSVVLWYHFAFLSISLAMLGLGAPGVWFALRQRGETSETPGRIEARLAPALMFAGLAIPLSVLVIVRMRPIVLQALGGDAWVVSIVIAALVPLYALGYAVCALLIAAEGRAVGGMYAADLAGAACGALLVVFAMALLPAPRLLALAGLLPLAGLALLTGRAWRIAALAAGALLAAAAGSDLFRVAYTKTYDEAGERTPLHEVWTPTARITVFDRPIFSLRSDVPWGWGYGTNFVPQPWPERWIDQDGSAGTPIEQLPGAPRALAHLPFDVTSAGYQIRAPERVCIVGAGGGRDIVTALAAGAREVTAVEINGAIVDLLRGPLADFAGGVYDRPGVHAVVSEGRSFLAGTDARYDLIQIALVDSWTATAAGAFALSENFLYTVEALRLYLDRLAPGGLLSISRYTDAVQPFEGARLVLLVEAALQAAGVAEPRAHLLFMSGGNIGTLLVGAQPLDAATLAQAQHVARARGFAIHWPRRPDTPPESLAALAMEPDARRALTEAGVDLRPPTDDRPFFFQAVRPFALGQGPAALAPHDPNLRSVATLRLVVALLAALALALFFAPFALFGRPARGPGFWSGSAYFALIGAGFMSIEVAFMGRCMLFLGHPSYAAAFVLATLLLGGGYGSRQSTRLAPPTVRRWIIALAPSTALLALALPPLFTAALAWSLPAKLALATPLFLAAGAAMGLALPTGFLQFGDRHKPWFWALNGASSVLASALSLALAMEFGFLFTALLGSACYALATALSRNPA